MHDVRVANWGEVVLAVVTLVWQSDPALLNHDEVSLRVARITVDEDTVETRESPSLELSRDPEHVADLRDRVHQGEVVSEWGRAEGLHPRLVHKARVEVTELLGLADDRRRLCLFNNLAHGRFGALSKLFEGAVARLVGGDGRARHPPLVHVTVQVVLGSNLVA